MWVTSTLVQIDNVKSRSEALGRFIDVAEHLRALKNFNGAMEVVAGLRNASIHRLKKTWASLSQSRVKHFEELMALMTPDANFSKLRKFLHQIISPPCIPYLGMYLTDLTFIEEGNPDFIGELINFDKRRRIAVVIKEIQQYQNEPYCFKEVSIIQGFLLAGGEYVDENRCYQLSLQVEPRDGKAKQVAKPWRKSTTVERKKALEERSQNQVIVIGKEKKENITPSIVQVQKVKEILPPVERAGSNTNFTVEELVEILMEGNNIAVEQYLETLDVPPEEKRYLSDAVLRIFDDRMERKAMQKLSFLESPEQENEEIPYETLVTYLHQGDMTQFDSYFEKMEIYEAERIREQTIKIYYQQLGQL